MNQRVQPPSSSRRAQPANSKRRSRATPKSLLPARRKGPSTSFRSPHPGHAWNLVKASTFLGRAAHRHLSYTVLREKVIVPFTTPTTGFTTMVIGPMLTNTTSLSGGFISPISHANAVCMYGSGAAAPFISGTAIAASSLLTNQAARVRLHRIVAEVSCVGTSTATAVPDGAFYAGVLRTPIDPFGFTSFNAMGAFVMTRQEVRARSNLSVQYHAAGFNSYMLDGVSYDQFSPLSVGASINNFTMHDSMAPIVFCWPSTISPVGMVVTIHLEWCVMFDQDPILQASSTAHPIAPPSYWDQATDYAKEVGGEVMGDVSSAAGAAFGGFAARTLGEAGSAAARIWSSRK